MRYSVGCICRRSHKLQAVCRIFEVVVDANGDGSQLGRSGAAGVGASSGATLSALLPARWDWTETSGGRRMLSSPWTPSEAAA